MMSSGTVSTTPAAMMLPNGVSKPAEPVNSETATVAVRYSNWFV